MRLLILWIELWSLRAMVSAGGKNTSRVFSPTGLPLNLVKNGFSLTFKLITFTFSTHTHSSSFQRTDPPHVWPTQRPVLVSPRSTASCLAAAPAAWKPVYTAHSELARTNHYSCSSHSNSNVGGIIFHGGPASTILDWVFSLTRAIIVFTVLNISVLFTAQRSPTGPCCRSFSVFFCFFFLLSLFSHAKKHFCIINPSCGRTSQKVFCFYPLLLAWTTTEGCSLYFGGHKFH